MFNSFIINKIRELPTPFYYYDTGLLHRSLDIIRRESVKQGFKVHYAVKANHNPRIMKIIAGYGFGADCVSGNEIKRALETGFSPHDILFAGVGKSDDEILFALECGIDCFNVESVEEIEVINVLAQSVGVEACIAIRINPNVDALTHNYISTGIEESKFGIHIRDMSQALDIIRKSTSLCLKGIHFHIGSQILNMSAFRNLCSKVNEVQKLLSDYNIDIETINVGGGLGIDHNSPDEIPPFADYFSLFSGLLKLKSHQVLCFELGRSVVGQCGALISRVLYVKDGITSKFAIIDAGMTDLLRPALYQAYHKIENLTSDKEFVKYSVVGPVCESSDVFARYTELPVTVRGDIIAVRSAGAYGETMASGYNMRDLPGAVFSEDILVGY